VGQRLREIRTQRGLSMKSLAEQSGLNVNTLSLIENGRTSPSVSTLQQLSQALHIPITEFFEAERGSRKLVFQKRGERPRLVFKHNTIEDLSAGMSGLSAEPMIVTLDPGADSGRKAIVHPGREFVYCLEGQTIYMVEEEHYLLEPGDSLVFEAYLPHHWENAGFSPSRILLVLCPLDERDNPVNRHFLH
jgi:transcriptional regulator with XRE-family HTH domain